MISDPMGLDPDLSERAILEDADTSYMEAFNVT